MPQLISKIPSIISQVKNAFTTSVDWGSVGMNIIKGIANGLKGAAGAIVEAAKGAAESALNAAKNALGIHSPSRVFRDQVGKMMALGILFVYLIMVAQFQSMRSTVYSDVHHTFSLYGRTLSSADLRKGDKYHSYAGTDNAGGHNRKQRYSDGRLYKSTESPRN